ncbi:MAG: glycosyltransferase [Cyanobacterium sp. T60_A2020_053]|nr:glycosyltransferase [Cyanobacterium sp. T60_A2020_053]
MKILMVVPYLCPYYGGISKIVQELTEALGKRNLAVDLITTDANFFSYLPQFEVDYNSYDWIDRDNYRLRYFRSWCLQDTIFSARLCHWLYNHVHEYDLVHTHSIFAPLITVTGWICRGKKVPYIITPHGMLEPWALNHKKWKKKLYYNCCEKSNLSHSLAIQGTSKDETKNIESLSLDTQVFFVHNGIHPSYFQHSITKEDWLAHFPHLKDKKLILFLARIDPKKGLDLLAKAFAQISQKFSDVHVIIAGPESQGFLPNAKKFFRDANCLNRVTFTGMLTGELKAGALESADIFVSPSYSEGFSISVLEAMGAGLPTVITTGCNFAEAGEVGGALVVNIDADEVARALDWCLSYPDKARALGNQGKEFIFNNYTWTKVAEKLILVYKNLLDNH